MLTNPGPGSSSSSIIGANANDIHLVFNDSAKPYAEESNAVFRTVTRFFFQGSDILGEIERFTCIANSTNSNTGYSIRLFDVTNSLEIAMISIPSISNTDPEIKSTTVISNIPTGEAILEVQAKTDGGGGKVQLSAGHIEFEEI